MSKSDSFSKEQAGAWVFFCLCMFVLVECDTWCIVKNLAVFHLFLCDLEHLFDVLEDLFLITK